MVDILVSFCGEFEEEVRKEEEEEFYLDDDDDWGEEWEWYEVLYEDVIG